MLELTSITGEIKISLFSRRLEEAGELVTMKPGQLKRSSLRSRKKKNKDKERAVGCKCTDIHSWRSRRGGSWKNKEIRVENYRSW